MSELHPVALLLPWYLTGTLKEEERTQVVQHLEGCHRCQAELEELTQFRMQLNTVFSELPGPSPRLHEAVMEKIQAHEGQKFRKSRSLRAPLLDAVEDWFRSLYRPKWVPALMMLLVLGQLGVLVWFAEHGTSNLPDGSSSNGVVSRGVPVPTVRIHVAFQGTAPEDKVRSVIMQLKGRVVDGPSREGFYTIEVPADEPVERRLEVLRAQSEVVRTAERVTP